MKTQTKALYIFLFLFFLGSRAQLWVTEYQNRDDTCSGSVLRSSIVSNNCYNLTTIDFGTISNTPKCTGNVPQLYSCKNSCNSGSNCFFVLDQTIKSCTKVLSNAMTASCSGLDPQKSTGYALYQEFYDASCTKPIWYPQNHTLTKCFTKSDLTSTQLQCSMDGVSTNFYNGVEDCSNVPLSITTNPFGQCQKNVFYPYLYIKYTGCSIPPSKSTSSTISPWLVYLHILGLVLFLIIG